MAAWIPALVTSRHQPFCPAISYITPTGAVQDLIRHCRVLTWALFTTWRWCYDDGFPDRDYWRTEGLNLVRAALIAPAIEVSGPDA